MGKNENETRYSYIMHFEGECPLCGSEADIIQSTEDFKTVAVSTYCATCNMGIAEIVPSMWTKEEEKEIIANAPVISYDNEGNVLEITWRGRE